MRIKPLLLAVALVVTACAAGPNTVSHVDGVQLAGFWKGLWHGLIYPVTFIISLFTDKVSIGLLHTVLGAGRRAPERRRRARSSTNGPVA